MSQGGRLVPFGGIKVHGTFWECLLIYIYIMHDSIEIVVAFKLSINNEKIYQSQPQISSIVHIVSMGIGGNLIYLKTRG